jgi:superfamily I DNA/RNA helicase
VLGRDVRTESHYVEIRRTGRSRRIPPEDRRVLWRLFEEHRDQAHDNNIVIFEECPALTIDALQADAAFRPYEYVVVDEAQDFTPVQLRLVKALEGGRHERMGIFADAAQRIYESGFRWKDAELNPPVGRQVVTLEQNFRNTVQIYEAAVNLAAGIHFEDATEDLVFASASGRQGPRPELVLATSPEQEAQAIVARIQRVLQTGAPPHAIAVLAGKHAALDRIEHALASAGVPWERDRPGQQQDQRRRLDIAHPSVKLLTAQSAKGLDFPHVYVVGLTTTGLTPPGQDEEARQAQRRLLYTAIIRAGLTLTLSAGGSPHALLAEIESACMLTRVA